jgi:hypothetical protein
MSGFPFEGVDRRRRANKRFVIDLILPRDTQLRRLSGGRAMNSVVDVVSL